MPDIRFTQPIAYPDYTAPKDYSLLVFDIPRLNSEWKKNDWIHFKAEHLMPKHLQPMEQRLRTNQPFAMPVIRICEGVETGTECVDICDGRKRTAFLLSKGQHTMPAMVPTEQKQRFLDMGIARTATPQEERALAGGQFFPQGNARPVGV